MYKYIYISDEHEIIENNRNGIRYENGIKDVRDEKDRDTNSSEEKQWERQSHFEWALRTRYNNK